MILLPSTLSAMLTMTALLRSIQRPTFLFIGLILFPRNSYETISLEPGLRIMLVQLRYRFLPGISITFLKDAYGSFAPAINLCSLIVAVCIPPGEDTSVKFVPL